MNRPVTGPAVPLTRIPESGGWHCSHLFYSWNRARLADMSASAAAEGKAAVIAALDPSADGQPVRLQTSIVSGAKADFGLMLLDPDPLVIDAVHPRLMASPLGAALTPGYSFVSITEISEYVFTPEQFGERLVAEGEDPAGEQYAMKVKGYADRLVGMNRQRLTPEFPAYPATCFYPMNKIRDPDANWYTLPKAERMRMMSEHARSGIAFAGKVTQLVTASTGLDDWEWGVTLWAANPQYLKDIVYQMRFDEASAKYAAFGPFYTSYVCAAEEMLRHCRV